MQAPTLIIHGSESRLRALHERFLETIPNATGVLIGTTALDESPTRPQHLHGQFSATQAPIEWAAEIHQFLEKATH